MVSSPVSLFDHHQHSTLLTILSSELSCFQDTLSFWFFPGLLGAPPPVSSAHPPCSPWPPVGGLPLWLSLSAPSIQLLPLLTSSSPHAFNQGCDGNSQSFLWPRPNPWCIDLLQLPTDPPWDVSRSLKLHMFEMQLLIFPQTCSSLVFSISGKNRSVSLLLMPKPWHCPSP